jgi:hypothetical protein
LPWNEHSSLHFFKHKASGLETEIEVFEIDFGGIINENGPEVEVSTTRVKVAFFLR